MNYNNLTKQELLDLVTEQQTLKDAVDAKDQEILRLNAQLKTFEGSVKKEELHKYTKELEEKAKKAADIANHYIRAYKDILTIFKVNLDSAITRDELLSEKLK